MVAAGRGQRGHGKVAAAPGDKLAATFTRYFGGVNR